MSADHGRRSETQPPVAWITNFDAPYRRPVWDALGGEVDLRVWVLQGSVSGDRGANRTDEWDSRSDTGSTYSLQAARTLQVRRRGEAFYGVLRPKGFVANVEAVVLAGWESPAYWQIARAARRRGVRLIGFYESHGASSRHTTGAIARARRHWFRNLDSVVVPGVASRTALLELGVQPERIIEGFNAVDVSTLRARSLEARALTVRPGGHRYLYVGQLIERKNVESLVRAFARSAAPEDLLTIAGQGPLLDHLRGVADRSTAHERITFVGHVPYSDLPELFARADTLVLPSSVEVWGLVVNEALACGLRVVVSDQAGVAASVRGMDGVVITAAAEDAILDGLRAAKTIELDEDRPPAILVHTPEALADRFSEAIAAAFSHPLPRRGR